MKASRFSTSTVLPDGRVVPWLAAQGELSYSPENPPDRDYYFQYSWVLPGIFNPKVNKRHHYWFGHYGKDSFSVQRLLSFWNNARAGHFNKVFIDYGLGAGSAVQAPIAIYRHRLSFERDDSLIFIQHGSYLMVDVNTQPDLETGQVRLYRGVQNASEFKLYRVKTPTMQSMIAKVHAETLTDSVVSFNAVHSNVCRSETTHLNDRSTVLDEACQRAGLPMDNEEIINMIYSGFAMEDWCGVNKFGPNNVVFSTPVTNIRLTSFIANETEVKVIDPNKLTVVEAVGCQVKEVEI